MILKTLIGLTSILLISACASGGPPIGLGVQESLEWMKDKRKSDALQKQNSVYSERLSQEEKQQIKKNWGDHKKSTSYVKLSQLSLKNDMGPVDPRVVAARREILEGFGRAKELTFTRNNANTGENYKLIENEARDFVALLGGTSVSRNGNFYIGIESTARHGSQQLYNETITVTLGSQTGAIASYTAELTCGPRNQWRAYNDEPRHCRVDKATIREIFYRLADRITG